MFIFSNKKKRILIFFLFIFSLKSCLDFNQNIFNVDENIKKEAVPNVVILNFKAGAMKMDKKIWDLISTKAREFTAKKEVYLEKLNVNVFDEKGNVTSSIKSDTGIYYSQRNDLILYTNVFIRSSNGVVMEGDYFYWDNIKEQLSSPYLVKVTRSNGSVITGVGMVADKNLEEITFSNSSGVVHQDDLQ